MSFLSIKTFKHIYKRLNKYTKTTYGREHCPLSQDRYKPIIGNAMEIIETKYPSNKNIKQKYDMVFYICKKILDKNFAIDTSRINDISILGDSKPKEIITQQPVNPLFERIMDHKVNDVQENVNLRITKEINKPIHTLFVTEQEPEEAIDLNKRLQGREEFIIPIDEFNKNKPIKTRDILIDSRDRNFDDHSNPNSYSIELKEPIFNVLSIDLTVAILPNSEYIVNSGNNILYFQETSGTTLLGTITEGNYTTTELVAEIQSQLNIDGSSTYTLSFIGDTLKITSDLTGGGNIFSLIFENKENSIHELIGYNTTNLSGTSNYTADSKIILEEETEVFLHLKGFDNIHTVSDEKADNFAKLDLTSEKGSYTFLKALDMDQKHYTDIPKKLHKLQIQFYKNNGKLYEFGGLEHSLMFRVVHYNFDNFYHG